MNKIASFGFASLVGLSVVGCASKTEDVIDDSSAAFSSQSVSVSCSSNGYRYATCDVDTHGGVIVGARVENQISHSACTEGTSWGYGRDYIWVDHGCRASFSVDIRGGGGGGGYGTIRVLDATYGGNVGASYGNATNNVSRFCNGQYSCDYFISVNELGDPAYGQRKDFNVDWSCSYDDKPHHAHIDAEANGLYVYLTCP